MVEGNLEGSLTQMELDVINLYTSFLDVRLLVFNKGEYQKCPSVAFEDLYQAGDETTKAKFLRNEALYKITSSLKAGANTDSCV